MILSGLWAVVSLGAAFASEISEPKFLDQLIEDVSTNRPKDKRLAPFVDRRLDQTWKQLQVGTPIPDAKSLKAFSKASRMFKDHWTAAEATSATLQATRALDQNQFDRALELSRQASRLWLAIHETMPDSSYEKRHEDLMGECDLIAAQALVKKKQFARALDYFHLGFARLSQVQLPKKMYRDRIEDFSLACQKAINAQCAHWALKLARAFPDAAVEKKLILERMPYFAEIPSPEFGYRYNPIPYRSPDQDQKAFDEAFGLVVARKYSESIEKFETLLKEFPRTTHRLRISFWLGRLYGLDGNVEKSRSLYAEVLKESPLTYYGLLAAFALGITPDSVIDATLPRALSSDPFLTPIERLRFERVAAMWRWLPSETQPSWIGVDLKDFRPRSSLSSPFLMFAATLASRAGRHLTAFNLIGDLIQRGYPGVTSSYVLRMIFPMPFQEWIQAAAQEEQLDPSVVISLIKQESAFDPEAVSSSGALGLMQLMPFTAVEVDGTLEQRQILDPKTNIRLGTKYLSQLLRKFGGNTVYALAGYNAGPHRVRAWRREASKDGTPESDMLEFIETIPFNETRGYVSSIMRNYFWYTYLINGKPLQSLTSFWGVNGPLELPTELKQQI